MRPLQGVLVLLPCFTAVSLFVYIFNTVGSTLSGTLFYYIYIYILLPVLFLIVLMFGLYSPSFIVFAILTIHG
jgi:hypothetical protein